LTVLHHHSTKARYRLNLWLALAETEPYRRALAIWCGVFCAGFFLLPGEWPQRVLFYGGLPLTLPGVVAVVRPLWASPLARALAAFLLFSALSALWSDHWLTVGDEARKALCIAYFLAICCAVGRDGLARWLWLLAGVQVFAAVAATLLAADYLWHCHACGRFIGYGRFANSNYTASVTGAVALLGLAATLSRQKGGTLSLLACQLPIGFLLVLTGSRAALLAYLSGVVLSVILIKIRNNGVPGAAAQARRAIPAAVGCVALIGAATAWRGTDWVTAEIARGDNHRLEIWAANISRFAQRPWFGHGATTPDPFIANGIVLGYHAHNLFLAQAFYGGVFGLLLFLSVSVLAARAAFTAWRESGDILPLVCLWFLFAIGMVDLGPIVVDIQAIWLYVWAILGIVLSCDVARRARISITFR
jgi:O-antigen ligase